MTMDRSGLPGEFTFRTIVSPLEWRQAELQVCAMQGPARVSDWLVFESTMLIVGIVQRSKARRYALCNGFFCGGLFGR